jgi:hypothetical protein
MGISLSKLAKELGRAKSGLHKLAQRGQIPRLEDGTFDLHAVTRALQSNLDPARRRPVASGRVNGKRRERPALPRTDDEAREAVQLIRRVLEEEGVSNDGAISFDMVRTAAEILRCREREHRLQKARSEVYDREPVEELFFSSHRGIRDSWMNWPSRIGAQMAAELGVDQVVLMIILDGP